MPRQRTRSRSVGLTSITYWRRLAHRWVFLFLAGIMGLGLVVYFGGGSLSGMGRGYQDPTQQTIATVNDVPLTRAEYTQAWDRVGRGTTQSPGETADREGRLVQQLIQMALLRSIAEKRQITVSDGDVDKAVEDYKKANGARGKPLADSDLREMLQAQGLTEDDFRAQLRSELVPRALEASIASSQRVTEDDLLKSYDKIKVRHILIATADSPRAAPGALPDAQAKTKAEKVLAELRKGADFARLADEYSMDPSNKAPSFDPKTRKTSSSGKGGDLGWYTRGGGFAKPFEDAAFALKPGQTSDLVKTDFGYHIIRVDAAKRELPKDFAKKKTEYLNQLRQQRTMQAMDELMREAAKTMKIVWKDPTLEWRYDYVAAGGYYGLMMGGDPTRQQAFIDRTRPYLKAHKDDGVAALVLARMLDNQYMMASLPVSAKPGKPAAAPDRTALRDEIIEDYRLALAKTEDQQARLRLAQLYRESGNKDQALKTYVEASRILGFSDETADLGYHRQLVSAFQELGKPDLAAKEMQTVATLTVKEQAERKKAADEARKNASAKGGAAAGPGGTVTIPAGGAINVQPAGEKVVPTGKPASDQGKASGKPAAGEAKTPSGGASSSSAPKTSP